MKKKVINPTPESQVQQVTWNEVRDKATLVCPTLAKIIDDLNPNLPLSLGKYSYGAMIASGESNQPLPNFLVLDKSCELFWEYKDRPITQRITKAGEMILGNFNSKAWGNPLWRLSSGGQNVFMPAKISDYEKHKKLQDHFGFEVNRPLKLEEQRHVFNLIANSHQIADKWQSELLFFDDAWFQHQDDPAWQPFYKYLLQEELKHHSNHNAYHHIFHLLMSIFQHEKSKKLTVSHIEQLSQLFMLAVNETHGFIPLQDEHMMPLKLIQLAYLEYYKLKQYEPIIMGPGYFNEIDQNREAIYLSISHRNFYQFSPSENQSASTAKEFYQLYWAFERLIDFIESKNYLSIDNEIYQAIKKTDFTFYHSGSQIYEEFIPTEEILLYDKAFGTTTEKGFQFPAKSSFFNGCVQLRRLSE